MTAEAARRGRVAEMVPWLVTAWLAVLAVEWFSLPNASLFTLAVQPFEAALWMAAAALTAVTAARAMSAHRLLAALATAAVTVPLGVYLQNWSVWEPRSYFALHRAEFDAVARFVDEGRVDDSYNGVQLPRRLADLSTTGRVRRVIAVNGAPAFLPEGLHLDGAIGYVYLRGTPDPDLVVYLTDDPRRVADGVQLGRGWWWLG